MTVNTEKRTRVSKLVLQHEGVVSNLRLGPRLRDLGCGAIKAAEIQ